MKEKNKLFVLGSINVDLSIDCLTLPKQGETIEGKNFNVSLGGKGANQAHYAAELGTQTILIGNVGDDFYGDYVLKSLKENKTINKITRHQKQSTGIAVIVNTNNDNQIILDAGANKKFGDVNFEELKSLSPSDIVLSQLEINEDFILEIFKYSKKINATTILNPAPANIKNLDLYKYIDYLILNETECQKLLNLKVFEDCISNLDRFFKLGVKKIILTLGNKGSFYIDEKQKFFQNPKKIKVVNTTGAGDSFIGALLNKILQNQTIKEAISFANSVSAFVCTQKEVQVKNILEKIGG